MSVGASVDRVILQFLGTIGYSCSPGAGIVPIADYHAVWDLLMHRMGRNETEFRWTRSLYAKIQHSYREATGYELRGNNRSIFNGDANFLVVVFISAFPLLGNGIIRVCMEGFQNIQMRDDSFRMQRMEEVLLEIRQEIQSLKPNRHFALIDDVEPWDGGSLFLQDLFPESDEE